MSSDGECMRKPCKRRNVIISGTESSDDSIIVPAHRKRKVYRVVSEAESSDDDSDVPKPVIRRKNHRVVSEDDGSGSDSSDNDESYQTESDDSADWQSDWDSSDESQKPAKSESSMKCKKEKDLSAGKTADFESDTSDGQSEKCPICLLPFRNQEVGNPAACEHCFCLECIIEWSKNINTCPVDRQTFTTIHVRDKLGGKVIKQLPVEVKPRLEDQIQEDPTFCEICNLSDREDRMLLCDGCDSGYHLECLTPPMNEVPMDEWFCPECSQNSQNDAEAVDIDLDEIPDLMEEARRLGISYGRTRTGIPRETGPARVIPRTRQTERVRANIRADRNRNRAREVQEHEGNQLRNVTIDFDQPSTSSGFDSIGENSRSRSPETSNNSRSTGRRASQKARKKGSSTRKSKKKRKTRKREGSVLREVRIVELNQDGQEEEIVTYVKISQNSRTKRKRRRKGRKKRRARTVSSVLKRTKTVKRRLATALGVNVTERQLPHVAPIITNGKQTIPERSALINARYNAGITQVSLFGNNLGLDYSPPGSDEEQDCPTGNGGIVTGIQRRSAIPSTRRRLALKNGIINPSLDADTQSSVTDLIGSILSSQELWHSKKKSEVTLKADGTILVKNKDNNDNKHSINNNESPIKKNELIKSTSTPITVEQESAIPANETPLDLSAVSSQNITQAPMYNSGPRGGGGGNRGNFRGGYNRDNRHSYGGNGSQNYRDNYSNNGRHSYGGGSGGGGGNPRDNSFPGSRDFNTNYNPNFEHCGLPPQQPPFANNQMPFRNRNPQHFRNRFTLNPFQNDRGVPHGNVFHHPPHHTPPRPRNPPPNIAIPPSVPGPSQNVPFNNQGTELISNNFEAINFPEENNTNPSEFIAESNAGNEKTGNNDEECDIYCDIDQPSNNKDSNVEDDNQTTLLPPPEPPSELLDFEENSKSSDKDSDQELVIDDTPKEEHNPSAVANRDLKPEDKYDPFENESDSNDSGRNKEKNTEKRVEETTEAIPIPLDPPPSPPNFLLTSTSSSSMQKAATGASAPSTSSTIRLTAYDDDDEDDSQSDCPNFSVYSSETMDVARHTEQELSQQIGPLEPPPLPPEIPDDDDVILGDVQTTDLTDIPEPSDPYVESLRKERQALSKIPPKKITSHDTRGKITFKIGNKFKLNNKLSNLYDELDENIEITIEQEKEAEAKRNSSSSTSKTAIGGSSSSSNINNNEKEKLNESEKDEKVPNEVEEDAKNAFSGNKKGTNSAIFESKMETEEKIVPEELEVNIEKSTIDLTEKSSDTIISIADTIASSSSKLETEKSNDNEINDEDDAKLNKKAKTKEKEDAGMEIEADVEEDDEDLEEKELNQSDELKNDESGEKMVSPTFESDEETENFPLEKDKIEVEAAVVTGTTQPNWDSDGAYTPCRDELPIKEKHNKTPTPTFESGLEPITPTRDKTNDDLDGCRTPAAYAGLGTEAISETDEAMNFEDELTLLSLRKDKEIEEGEIMEDKAPKKGATEKSKEKDDEKKKKKKDKKEKKDSTEKNKENISSDNQVAWKKISKSTKDRPYRDKDRRSRSKDNKKKKNKEPVKKKEKRKELPRYDVRKIVADKPPRPRKDEYGRDIREKSRSRSRSKSFSRKRSFSRDRKSRSYSHGRSRSRTRSRSRLRRSWSRDRRSYSKTYRSLSRRRSLSRKRKSPRRNSSVSRTRRSVSRKRSVSPRRRSLSRKRRSLSPRRRSRRSLSRHRSPKHRSKSRERDHRVKKDKVKKHNKSRSRSRNNRKRSKSKTRDKKHTKRKPVASRSRSKERSVSRERNRNWAGNAAAGSEHLNEKNVGEHFIRDREESWSAQWTPSWSRSRSKTPPLNHQTDIDARGGGWSPQPVLDSVTVPPKNLTVILTNKEAIKKKKKEKRKENKKPKDVERRRRGRRVRTPPPSKEVFASGDNILVSVCFNKENETAQTGIPELPETIPLLATTKRRRRDTIPTSTSTTAATAIQSEQPPLKRPKKDKVKDKRSKSPKVKKDKKKKSKAAEIAATKKPVAVIDLDQSPFREQTPSPRDVIVLSDDDDKQAQEIATPDQHPSHESPPRDGQFVSQGPKTPPEPQLTYSNQQTNLRPQINPINEEDEEEEEELDERADEELELRAQEELELRLKIGPNTPPEPPSSPPTSPDAYDPFDPTKSRSPTPDVNQEANLCDERNQRTSPSNNNNVPETSAINESAQQQEQTTPEKPSEKPKIISMVTIKRAASPQRDTSPSNDQAQTEVSQPNESPSKAQSNQTNTQSASNPFATINPVLATVAAAVQRSTIFASSTPLNAQRNLLQANRISPSNQIKQRTNDRPQLPNIFTNSTKQTITTTTTTIRTSKTLQNKNSSTLGQNGSDATIDITNDNVIDMSSPYSPGSSMSDGIFDPPSPANYNNSPVVGTATTTATSVSTANNKTNQPKKSADKKPADAFDALFGSSPVMRNIISTKTSSRKKTTDKKKKCTYQSNTYATNPKVGVRMDENQLQILDDLPSSAVEMQVKDKFLKKLNRQERVVEEVKLVLKPHYTKKHVTKDEYKDIMRKAVPKICHNKTGEINPKKIAQLIEAYVRKCRNKKKVPSSTATSTTNATSKASKPVKRLWS